MVSLFSEPIVNVQSLDALEMPLVVGHQTISFDDGGRGDEDVGVADQLSSPVQVGIDFRRLHHYSVGEGQDSTGGAETVERRPLPGCTFGFEAAQDLVARDDREHETLVDTELVLRPCGHRGIAPQDGG